MNRDISSKHVCFSMNGNIHKIMRQYLMSISPDLTIVNYLIAVDYDTLGQYKNALPYYKTFTDKYTEQDEYLKYAQTRAGELENNGK